MKISRNLIPTEKASLSILLPLLLFSFANGSAPLPREFTNSLGIKMILIPAGSFRMGVLNPTPHERLGGPEFMPQGDWDETPVHNVTLSSPFYLSETEITAEQFSRFHRDFRDAGRFSPFASGISWDDAVAFCEWLSKREGKTYRLPTEAEWEYSCRAGSSTPFSSGQTPPLAGIANGWGIKNMHTGVAEWCFDWHGAYPDGETVDPIGPAHGVARVVRGGGIQLPVGQGGESLGATAGYYRRSANRAGVAPSYHGRHLIGFRIVQAPLPATKALESPLPFIQQCVKKSTNPAYGPDLRRPYFRWRDLLPIPPENVPPAAIKASGLHPGIGAHNHAPGLVVCPNGDLLAVWFSSATSFTEYWPDVSFIAARLRFGSEAWDMPDYFLDFPDVNDQTALLWNENGTLRLFTGGVGLQGVPFRLTISTDSGATWSPIQFPMITGRVGGYTPQPITSAFRDAKGIIYFGSDGAGGDSLLWASADNGKTWYDTGGRTGGRHTTFALLSDGSMLGMGGKSTDIDGYMPKSISHDSGKSWEISKTGFAALGSNQRPVLIRLASGRLFFAGDFQHYNGAQPEGIRRHGSYVALSGDDGQSWRIKELPHTRPHESQTLGLHRPWARTGHSAPTLGYTVATQAPNGIIHLITTMNHPSLHFELNEAWILSDVEGDAVNPPNRRFSPDNRMNKEERNEDGSLRTVWSAFIDSSGSFVLDGTERWYYPDGSRQYEVNWKSGQKTGKENYWTKDGKLAWSRNHREDGVSVWTQFWPNGRKKSVSSWKDGKCEGRAERWNSSGKSLGEWSFANGMLLGEEGKWKFVNR